VDLENIRQLFGTMVPFVSKVGIEIDEAAPNHIKLRFPKDITNTNHVGSYHAGALFTFAETCAAAGLAMALDLSRYRLLVKQGEITYKRGVFDEITCTVNITPEQVAEVTSVVDAEGRGIFPVTVEFIDVDDQVAVEATMSFHLKKLP
jgi:acyl-coenzyme A thioesterase PaaI-like protein